MTTAELTDIPPAVERLQQRALVVAALGLLASVAGGFADPQQFFRSYLFAWLAVLGFALGCLAITMIHHLSGGLWGAVIRRLVEAGTRTLPLLSLLFLPIAFGFRQIYPWASPPPDADRALREAIAQKHAWLAPAFFFGRAVFYFVAWNGLAWVLNSGSRALDGRDDPALARRLRSVSGGGLVLLSLTITFSSFDWAMSLDPRWFSTIYGVLFMVGDTLSAFCLAIVLLTLLWRERPLSLAASPDALHDVGKLTFAFVMLWAYMQLSQFLIIWSGNLPEEIPWYLRRMAGGWQWVSLFIVLFQFTVPFLLLLSRSLKRNPARLGPIALGLVGVRLVDLFWFVAPEFHPRGFHLHWLDVALPVGLGGIWTFVLARELRTRPMLPLGDPDLRAALEGAHA